VLFADELDEDDDELSTLSDQPALLESSDSSDESFIPEYSKLGEDGDFGMAAAAGWVLQKTGCGRQVLSSETNTYAVPGGDRKG
jgi:hypothetical protein